MAVLLKPVGRKSRHEMETASLRRLLSPHNPYISASRPALLDAANTFIQRTADDPAEANAIGWAVYAERATRWLHPGDTAREHAAGRVLAALVAARGQHADADLVAIPNDISTAAARLTRRLAIARLLHDTGLCDDAIREATAAMFRWMPRREQAPELGGTCFIEMLALLEQCMRLRDAQTTLVAFSALLPDLSSDVYDALVTCAHRRLGQRSDLENHQRVCGVRAEFDGNRWDAGKLQSIFLEQLYDENSDGDRVGPTPGLRAKTRDLAVTSDNDLPPAHPGPRAGDR